MIRIRTTFTRLGTLTDTLSTQNYDFATVSAQQAYDNTRGFWNLIKDYIDNDVVMTVDPTYETVSDLGVIQGVGSVTASTAITGTDPGDPLPLQTQALVSMGTGDYIDGRELRGRIYIPYMTENFNQNGVMNAAATAAIKQAATFQMAGTTSGTPASVWSRKHGLIRDVTTIRVTPTWAVLRSRRQ